MLTERSDFQVTPKSRTDWILQMLMESAFQICDAEILKPQDPNDKLRRGITS